MNRKPVAKGVSRLRAAPAWVPQFRAVLITASSVFLFSCSDSAPPSTGSAAQAPSPAPQVSELEVAGQAQTSDPVIAPQLLEVSREDRLIARIQDRTADELSVLLMRAEQSIAAWEAYPDFDPIEFILDGPEARLFVRSNYTQHRDLVDRAARLDAFGVIDVKICERWMEANEVLESDFPAFVDTVNYGPAAKRELLREGYIYF